MSLLNEFLKHVNKGHAENLKLLVVYDKNDIEEAKKVLNEYKEECFDFCDYAKLFKFCHGEELRFKGGEFIKFLEINDVKDYNDKLHGYNFPFIYIISDYDKILTDKIIICNRPEDNTNLKRCGIAKHFKANKGE